MVEDTQDKVRRNLVTFCALILLIQFLGLRLNTPTTIFGIFSVQSISEVKMWGLSLIVLTYLFGRYWFDDVTVAQKHKMKDSLASLRSLAISKIMEEDVIKALLHNKEARYIVNIEDTKAEYSNYVMNYPNVVNHRMKVGFERYPIMLEGGGDIALTYAPGFPVQLVPYTYRLSGQGKTKAVGYPLVRILLTKSSFDYLIPLVLTILAYAVCLWHFGSNVAKTYMTL